MEDPRKTLEELAEALKAAGIQPEVANNIAGRVRNVAIIAAREVYEANSQ